MEPASDGVAGGDEPRKEKDEPREWTCPRCDVGAMVLEREILRPTVHQAMQMTFDELRRLTQR